MDTGLFRVPADSLQTHVWLVYLHGFGEMEKPGTDAGRWHQAQDDPSSGASLGPFAVVKIATPLVRDSLEMAPCELPSRYSELCQSQGTGRDTCHVRHRLISHNSVIGNCCSLLNKRKAQPVSSEA